MSDHLAGKTLHWSYEDGAVGGKTYQHAFGTDGSVTWSEGDAPATPGGDSTAKYEYEHVNNDVYVVSYLSKSGYALTTVVDTKSGRIVSFASNEKSLSTHHGKLGGRSAG
jgi:hypothetical protein